MSPQPDCWNAWVWFADGDGSESDLDLVGTGFATPEAADRAVRDAYYSRRGQNPPGGGKPLGQVQWGTHGMAHDVTYCTANVAFTNSEGERVGR